MNSPGTTIALIGISIPILYAITKLLNFYGYGPETYGFYLCFYIFLMLSTFILPTEVPSTL